MNTINFRYTVVKKLGDGAVGSVYLVQDLMYNKVLRALKVIRVSEADPERVATLRREFSILQKFDHPNIVKVYDFGSVITTDTGDHIGDFFFTLDYIQGRDLFQATEAADDEFIASLVFQIGHALEYIHRHSLIHFDIKPENIIVTEIQVGNETIFIPKIIDFGFAAPLLGPLSGTLKGSLHYIAPELLSGTVYDTRVDLFSLGVTLYRVLTRTLPFDAEDPITILKNRQQGNAADIRTLRRDTGGELTDLVVRLMEKDPNKRLANARDVADAVRPLIRSKEIIDNYSGGVSSREFVGRKKELQHLMNIVRHEFATRNLTTVDQSRKITCVVGEQGIGKTPLLEEWRRQAQSEGFLVIGIHCYLKTSPPLEAFRWFLHELKYILLPRGARARELLAEYIYLFSALAYEPFEEKDPKPRLDFANEERKLEFLRSIVRLLKEASALVPFALSIDDFHLADEMSTQLIRLIARTQDASFPFVLLSCDSIATIRKELQIEPEEANIVTLAGIDEEGVAELIRSQLGVAHIPNEIVRAVSNIVGDSPYVLKEFLNQFRLLAPEEALVELEQALRIPTAREKLPQSVNDVYARRFRRFSEEEQSVVCAVSCFRSPVQKEILGTICELPPDRLSHNLVLLIMGGVFVDSENGSKVYFSHAGFRQFVYQNLGTERPTLQGHIAAILERRFNDAVETDAEEIGYHYKEAGMQSKAFSFFLRAAHQMASAYLLQESNVLLEEAIQLASSDEEIGTVQEQLAAQSDLVEDYEKAESLYNALLMRPHISASQKYGYLKALGAVQIRRGRLDDAEKSFTQASGTAQSPEEMLEIEDELADIDIARGKLFDARVRCTSVLKHRSEGMNDSLTSSLLTKLGIISFYESKYDESTGYFEKAYEILKQNEDKTKLISPLLNLGNVYSVRHKYDQALESWNQALHHAEEVGNFHQQGQILNNLGIAEYNQGHYDAALINYEKGLALFDRLGNAPGRALCSTNIGEVHMMQAQYEKAFDAWEQCLELYRTINDAHGLAATYFHLIRLFVLFEDIGQAREHLRQSKEIIEQANLEAQWPIYYLCRSSIALAEKQFDEAEESARLANEELPPSDDDITSFELLILRGKICRGQGKNEKAAHYFKEAAAKSVGLNLPLLQAEALRELGIEVRNNDGLGDKRALNYFKDAYELIAAETVTDITWKICYDMGKELSIRGLALKSREFYMKAKHSLLYLSSLYTRQDLLTRFWETNNRGETIHELEILTDGK